MTESAPPSAQHARDVQLWLLAVLRFAVTLDHVDRLAVLAAAAALDKVGAVEAADAGSFRFFRATSSALCNAIATPDQVAADPVLRRHLCRIEDVRLRRAFAAALDRQRFDGAKSFSAAPRQDHLRKRFGR